MSLYGWWGDFKLLDPIPAGGGVILTPLVVFFYITQEVLV